MKKQDQNVAKNSDLDKLLAGVVVDTPADLYTALDANPKALEQWQSISENARQDWMLWVVSAKLSKTREKRIQRAVEELEIGKKRICCFGGKNWLLKTMDKKSYKNVD